MAIFGFDHLAVRLWACANDFMVFASSAIVTGVISYFLNEYSLRSAHIVYQEVIAVITLAVYCVALLLPVIGKYRGQLLPFNLIFSYLWLTSFIFAAQDWTGGRCQQNGPATSGCALKKTVVAFDFLALIFLFLNIASETALWRVKRGKHESEKHPHKRAASEATTVDSTTPATTPAVASSV